MVHQTKPWGTRHPPRVSYPTCRSSGGLNHLDPHYSGMEKWNFMIKESNWYLRRDITVRDVADQLDQETLHQAWLEGY